MLTLTLTLGWRMIGSSLSPIVMPSSLEVVLVPKHEQQLIISLTRIYLFWIFKPAQYNRSVAVLIISVILHVISSFLIILIIIWPKRKNSYKGFFWVFGSAWTPAPHESFFHNMQKQQKIYTLKPRYSEWVRQTFFVHYFE